MPESAGSEPARNNKIIEADVARKNYLLGVVNGAAARFGLGFIEPNLILAAFVYELTNSTQLVGVLATLMAAGMMWPQLYVSSLIEHQKRKKPYYIVISIARTTLLLVMALTVYLSGTRESTWMVILFLLAFFAFWSAMGSSVVTFLDLIGQTVVPTRLGGFFAQRAFWGDLLALPAGFLLVQPILHRVPFPNNYAILVLAAALAMSVGWGIYFMVKEPENTAPAKNRSPWKMLVEAARVLRKDRNYRGLLWIRVFMGASMLTIAFYIPYGVQRLGAVGMSGVLLGFISASRLSSNLVWGSLSNRKGNRVCLKWAGILFALSPMLALAAPHLPQTFQWAVPGVPSALGLPICVYLLALVCFGLAMQSGMVGSQAFLIESAPPDRRPSYIAFLNTATFPLTFLPALAGVLVCRSAFGLDVLFVVASACGVATLISAIRLTEVRKTVASD